MTSGPPHPEPQTEAIREMSCGMLALFSCRQTVQKDFLEFEHLNKFSIKWFYFKTYHDININLLSKVDNSLLQSYMANMNMKQTL